MYFLTFLALDEVFDIEMWIEILEKHPSQIICNVIVNFNNFIYCLVYFFKLTKTLNRYYHLLPDIVGPSNMF